MTGKGEGCFYSIAGLKKVHILSVIPAKAGIRARLQGIPARTSVRECTGSVSVQGLFSDTKNKMLLNHLDFSLRIS